MTEINISDAPAAAKIKCIRNKHCSNVNYAFSVGGDRSLAQSGSLRGSWRRSSPFNSITSKTWRNTLSS
jgi:hypothetical protein